jgi:hypothetical protein
MTKEDIFMQASTLPSTQIKEIHVCEREELITTLATASRLLQPAEEILASMASMESLWKNRSWLRGYDPANADKRRRYYGIATIVSLTILVVFCLIFVAIMLYTDIEAGSIPALLLGIGCTGVMYYYFVVSIRFSDERKLKKDFQKYKPLVDSLAEYTESNLLNSPAMAIPQDYRNCAILNNFLHYLQKDGALDWKDCVSMWKTDIHMATVEEEVTKTRQFAQQAMEYSRRASRYSAAAAWFAFWR